MSKSRKKKKNEKSKSRQVKKFAGQEIYVRKVSKSQKKNEKSKSRKLFNIVREVSPEK
jgi:hypothetical protein